MLFKNNNNNKIYIKKKLRRITIILFMAIGDLKLLRKKEKDRKIRKKKNSD